jgi:hypothetical protein
MSKIINLLIIICIIAFFFTCSSAGKDNAGNDGNDKDEHTYKGATVTKSVSDLPTCNSDTEGQLFYTLDTEEFHYCDGSSYTLIDLTGLAGADGADGISINWLGTMTTADEPLPCLIDNLNDAYYNSDTGISKICDSEGNWHILVQDGTDVIIDSTPPTVTDGTIVVSEIGATSVDVTWNAATDDTSNSLQLEYIAVFSTNDNINTDTEILNNGNIGYNGALTSATINNLNIEETYYFNVVAMDFAGNITPYNAVSATTVKFADNGDGTITDFINNIVWKKCSQGQNNDATCTGTATGLQYCAVADNSCNGNIDEGVLDSGPVWSTCNSESLGGKSWRVPTKDELKAIVFCSLGPEAPLPDHTLCNPGYSSPTIDSTLFPNSVASITWTTNSLLPAKAWFIQFFAGIANYDVGVSKDSSGYVRCVSDDL